MRIAVLHPAMRPDDPFAAVDAPAEVASLMPEHTFIDVVVHKATVGRQLLELRRQHIDVVVNLCDGAWDEDRPGVEVIHGLERLGLPYTGADARCYDPSRLTMKLACEAAGVPFPAFAYADGPHDAPAIAARLRPPYIVKHPQGYGSLDLLAASKVDDLPGLTEQIARITAAHGSALVEEFIAGREFMVLVAEPPAPAIPRAPGPPPRSSSPPARASGTSTPSGTRARGCRSSPTHRSPLASATTSPGPSPPWAPSATPAATCA
jgi:D-alanine-D-alanine ligase